MTIKTIKIQNYPIKLGQFLKLADMVQDGLEAKFMILEGQVEVNGQVEHRRGRQLHRDDVITFELNHYRCG
ncbi:MAG: RNA-binding S4 domain-containing protein [Desulfofustis sp.]|nr:RNA-binding S4 domain-containing protein [Desulfofustis sp.]NNK14405.1 RNA-binding S4 domain-containing protein [Desulfofustis sp.]